MYLCVFDPYAVKDLKKFPDYIQSAILQKIDYFISSDHPLDFAKKLKHSELGSYRFRVGDYRAIGEKYIGNMLTSPLTLFEYSF